MIKINFILRSLNLHQYINKQTFLVFKNFNKIYFTKNELILVEFY